MEPREIFLLKPLKRHFMHSSEVRKGEVKIYYLNFPAGGGGGVT